MNDANNFDTLGTIIVCPT